MNPTTLAAGIALQWDQDIVPQLTDYIRIPAKSPHFDPEWAAHGHIERVIRLAEAWAKQQPVKGLTVEIVRLPGRTPLLYFDIPATNKSEAHGAALRPPRQATGNGRVARRLRPVGSAVRERQAVWAGRRGRRLRDFRGAVRNRRPAGARHRALALRRHDRNLRGIGQLRPAGLSRRARAAHGQRRFRDRSGFGLRRLRSTVGDDVAARTGRRHPRPSKYSPRACTRATPAASCRRRFASRASCWIDSRTRLPAAYCPRRFTRRSRRSAWSRRESRGADPRRHGDRASIRSRMRRSRWSSIAPRRCSTARGGLHCRSPAPTACRRSRTPAMCCVRRPRSSCRCGCRRPSTASGPRTR